MSEVKNSGDILSELHRIDMQYTNGVPVVNEDGKNCIGIEFNQNKAVLLFERAVKESPCLLNENTDESKEEEEIKEIKGNITFFLKMGYIEFAIHEYTNEEKEYSGLFPTIYNTYSLISGEEFADYIDNGCFVDNDGTIADIFVDDYVSNLGIFEKGMHQGKFMISTYDFRKLCKLHKIKVNWANK